MKWAFKCLHNDDKPIAIIKKRIFGVKTSLVTLTLNWCLSNCIWFFEIWIRMQKKKLLTLTKLLTTHTHTHKVYTHYWFYCNIWMKRLFKMCYNFDDIKPKQHTSLLDGLSFLFFFYHCDQKCNQTCTWTQFKRHIFHIN